MQSLTKLINSIPNSSIKNKIGQEKTDGEDEVDNIEVKNPHYIMGFGYVIDSTYDPARQKFIF